MRFGLSSACKAIVIGVLGCAAAILVACGDTNGLLPGDQASKLSSALDGVSAACQGGDVPRAQSAAAQFRGDVARLRGQGVDGRLVRSLRQGAVTLQQLIDQTCTAETIPTETEPVPPPQTQATTPPPVTTPTTPPPDTGGETTPPPVTTPTTPPPDTGGETTPPPDTGGGTTPPPNTAPETGGGDTGEGDQNQPDVNDGNPGGALAPGQGGTP